MEMKKVASSKISAIGYESGLSRLVVEFSSGKRYAYSEVSAEEHAAIMDADSVGSHFAKNIRSKKPAFALPDAPKIDLGFVSPDEWKSLNGEKPDYGEPILIRINGVVQNITYALDCSGVESKMVFWLEPYYFTGIGADDLDIPQKDFDKVQWVYVQDLG